MGSLSEEDVQFFDTSEDIASVSDSVSGSRENPDSAHRKLMSENFEVELEFWIKNFSSTRERRDKFLKLMDLGVHQRRRDDLTITCCDENEMETGDVESNGGISKSSSFGDGFVSCKSSISCLYKDPQELVEGPYDGIFAFKIKNLNNGTEFIVYDPRQDCISQRLQKVGSKRLLTIDEFESRLGLSPLVEQVMRRHAKQVSLGSTEKRSKRGWLRRISASVCIMNRQWEAANLTVNHSNLFSGVRVEKVKVHSSKKRFKELSTLYMGQNIQAHEGSILAMKFSPDGQYLASAGEDSVVRVWQVSEVERLRDFDIHDTDPSNVYFSINNSSEILPVHADKEVKYRLISFRKKSDKTCVIIPQKGFQVLEKPIHEFCGHSGDILDLSWSNTKCILSSSVDKTVRLWKVGHDECLKVFVHSNYVTCVQFNPVDDNHFISGSIDGKVRIWTISGCKVVDWTDIRKIVTAVCYHPDGQGAIVGSINGKCLFYDASDNLLQLCKQLSLQCKKKSPSRRITCFQFLPGDPNKVMVTSADSQVQILYGVNVMSKFQGPYKAGSQMSASFASCGMHIVSASEDSNIYLWNYEAPARSVPQPKNIRSCERFFSSNLSVAIPWSGMTSRNSTLSEKSETLPSPDQHDRSQQSESDKRSRHSSQPSSSEHFPLVHRTLALSSAMSKSQYKLLTTCFQTAHSSPQAWGLVIVTAGWDGRIRSFLNYGLPVRM